MYRVSRRYARGRQRHLLCTSTKNQDTKDKHRDIETKTGTNRAIKTNTNTDTKTKSKTDKSACIANTNKQNQPSLFWKILHKFWFLRSVPDIQKESQHGHQKTSCVSASFDRSQLLLAVNISKVRQKCAEEIQGSNIFCFPLHSEKRSLVTDIFHSPSPNRKLV